MSAEKWAEELAKLMDYDWEMRVRLLYDLEHGNAKDWLEDFEKRNIPEPIIRSYKENFGIKEENV